MKVLALQANPHDTEVLRIAKEAREIRRRLAPHSGNELIVVGAVRTSDLLELLQEYQPDVVHFSGHGNKGGLLVLEDDVGASSPIPSSALAGIFAAVAATVKCVVLNSCYSHDQASAIVETVPCVVGMGSEISDEAAIAFAVGFYGALGFSSTVQKAFQAGCANIALNSTEHLTPKMQTRPGVDPAQLIIKRSPRLVAEFDIDPRAGRPKKSGSEYSMKVFVEDAPPGTTACVYQYIDPTDDTLEDYENAFDEIQNLGDQFPNYVSFYGDVIIRATLWSGSTGTGIGISRHLKDALRETYANDPRKFIRQALDEIEQQ
jgi:CHAT domain